MPRVGCRRRSHHFADKPVAGIPGVQPSLEVKLANAAGIDLQVAQQTQQSGLRMLRMIADDLCARRIFERTIQAGQYNGAAGQLRHNPHQFRRRWY